MNIKITLSIFIFYISIFQLTGQEYFLKGNITDVSNTPISNVSVYTEGQISKGTASNENGVYELKLKEGKYYVVFSAIGYKTRGKKITLSKNIKNFNIQLEKSNTQIAEVVIKTKKNASVNKLNIRNLDAPLTTVSVGRKYIEQRNITNISDALKAVTGVRPRARLGSSQSFFIRGTNNVVQLIDGVRDERHHITTNKSAPNTNLANIERIEVLKGPAGSLYGHSIQGGIINIIRKKPSYIQKGNAKATYGSYNTYNMEMGLGGPISDNLRYRIDAGINRTDGWRGFGVATNNASLMLDLTPTNKHRFEVYVQANRDKFDNDVGVPVNKKGDLPKGITRKSRFNDITDYSKRSHINVQLKYTHRFNSNLVLTNQTSYFYDNLTFHASYFGLRIVDENNLAKKQAFYYNHVVKPFQNSTELTWKANTGSIKHKLLVGYSYGYLDRVAYREKGLRGTRNDRDIIFPIKAPVLNTNKKVELFMAFRQKQESSGLYLQDWIEFSDKLKVLLGLRYDIFSGRYIRVEKIDNNKNVIAPGKLHTSRFTPITYRAGIVFQPIKDKLSLFGSYSNYFNPTQSRGADNKILDPDTGFQVELGTKFQNSDKLEATLSTFYLKQNELLERVPGQPFNSSIGSVVSKGFEVDTELNITNNFFVKAGYTYTNTEIDFKDKVLYKDRIGNKRAFVPDHLFHLWVNYQLPDNIIKGLGAGVGLNYVGDNYTNSNNKYKLPAYTVLNGSLFYQASKKVRIGLNIDNITDKHYYDSAMLTSQFYPGRGRNFKVSMAYNF